MKIISLSLSGDTLKSEQIDKLVLENSVCSEILSNILESIKENDEG